MTQYVEQEDLRGEPAPNPMLAITDKLDESGAPLYDETMFEQYDGATEYDDVSGYDEQPQDEQPASFSEIDAAWRQATPQEQQQYLDSLSPDDVKQLQELAWREQVDQQLEPVAAFHEARLARQQQQQFAAYEAEVQSLEQAHRQGEEMVLSAIREHGSRAVDPNETMDLANEILGELAEQGYDVMNPDGADYAIREAATRLGARATVRGILGRQR